MFPPERQHQSDIGLSKYLLQWMDQYFVDHAPTSAASLRARVDGMLATIGYYPGLQLQKTRSPTEMCTSMKRRHLMQVLPYCMLSLLQRPLHMGMDATKRLLHVFVSEYHSLPQGLQHMNAFVSQNVVVLSNMKVCYSVVCCSYSVNCGSCMFFATKAEANHAYYSCYSFTKSMFQKFLQLCTEGGITASETILISNDVDVWFSVCRVGAAKGQRGVL